MAKRHPVLLAVGLIFFILLAAFFLSYNPLQKKTATVEKELRITIPFSASMTEYHDTRGWFGDGEINAKIKINNDAEKAGSIPGMENWDSLPMPKDLSILIFGNDMFSYGNDRIREAQNVKNGLYYFRDRSGQTATPLLNRSSYNFTFALYDLNSDTLYFYRSDS